MICVYFSDYSIRRVKRLNYTPLLITNSLNEKHPLSLTTPDISSAKHAAARPVTAKSSSIPYEICIISAGLTFEISTVLVVAVQSRIAPQHADADLDFGAHGNVPLRGALLPPCGG